MDSLLKTRRQGFFPSGEVDLFTPVVTTATAGQSLDQPYVHGGLTMHHTNFRALTFGCKHNPIHVKGNAGISEQGGNSEHLLKWLSQVF